MMRTIGLLGIILGTLLLGAGPTFAHGENSHEPLEATSVATTDRPGVAGASDGAAHSRAPAIAGEADRLDWKSSVVSALRSLHPATVHFPIALFIMAGLTELFLIARPTRGELVVAVNVMVYGGAAGAVIAALFGWIHTGFWLGGETVMQVHRWIGTGLALTGVLAAYFAGHPSGNRTALRVLLVVIALALLVQGFLGAELARGANHLGM